MTKLDLLLQEAEVGARRVLIGTREQVSPLLYMTHADGKETVAGVPWRDAGENEITLALVRAPMRAGDVIAYSIPTEARSVNPPERWKADEPRAHSAKRRAGSPRNGDRRRVQPSPPQGRDVAHRAGRGRALHRPRPHARRRRHGPPGC
jgi:hypothetical protein